MAKNIVARNIPCTYYNFRGNKCRYRVCLFLTCINKLCLFNYFEKSCAYIERKLRMLESVFLYQWNLSRKRLKCFKKCDFNTVEYELIGEGKRTLLTNLIKKISVCACKCIRWTIRTNLWFLIISKRSCEFLLQLSSCLQLGFSELSCESPFLACINVLLLSSSQAMGKGMFCWAQGFSASPVPLMHICNITLSVAVHSWWIWTGWKSYCLII